MPTRAAWGPDVLSRHLREQQQEKFSVKDGKCYRKPELTSIFFEPLFEDVAKRICASCPARIDCINLFFDEEFGVFGGYTEKERRQIRKMRKSISRTPVCNLCLRTIGRCQCEREARPASPRLDQPRRVTVK